MEQGYIQSLKINEWSVPQSLPDASKALHRRGGKESNLILNRDPLIEYGIKLDFLFKQPKLELNQVFAFWSDQHYEGIRPIPRPIEELTAKDHLERLSSLIGWLVLDKFNYHQRMCERAKARKAQDSNYESPWLSVDFAPPQWLREMQGKYPPRSWETLELNDLVPLIEIRSEKLLEKLSLEQEAVVEQISYDSLLTKIQEELKTQNAKLDFETIVQLSQALHYNQNFLREVKQLNQISAESTAEREAKAQMRQACIRVRALLKNFFKWLKYQHNPTNASDGYRITPNYLAGFCNSLMNVAKFRYREVTQPRLSPDYADIEVVIELRNVRKEEINSDFQPNLFSPIKRDPTWKELGELLKELLVACAPRRKIASKPDYTTMGPMRPQTAVAEDLQKYLVMMFFRVIAPDRQHVVRELKQHDTLKLCWINWETRQYEEPPWDKQNKRYKVYYNAYKKLYYLDIHDAKDEKGSVVENPLGKAFSWVVFLDASQTKVDQDNAYRVPKICNQELEAWLHGREDFSNVWFNWPPVKGSRQNKWSKQQYYWCGYVDLANDKRLGFRETFNPCHDFVFTQPNGNPFSVSNMCRFYDAILWRFLGIRSNPHAIRSTAVGHFKLKGMTDAENESLAKLKSHSVKMQDSSTYNKLAALEKTARASEMITNGFLQQHGLNPEEYGLVEGIADQGMYSG